MWETWFWSLCQEDPLEKEMGTHSSILAIPWTEEPSRLQSMGLQSVGHDWVTSLSLLWCVCVCVCSVIQLCLTLCDPMHHSPPISSVCGIFQARILERVAISFSRGSFQPRDWTHISWVSCIGRQILYHCATWEAAPQALGTYWLLSSVTVLSPMEVSKREIGKGWTYWKRLQESDIWEGPCTL